MKWLIENFVELLIGALIFTLVWAASGTSIRTETQRIFNSTITQLEKITP